ncbi:MAG: hypothetical protein ACK5O2_05810 [Microthrixaceae bacterium]
MRSTIEDEITEPPPEGEPTAPQAGIKLAAVPRAFLRSAAYFTPPAVWRRNRRYRAAGLPTPGTSPLAAISVVADEVVLAGFKITREPPTAEAWERITGEVRTALDVFESKGWLDDPSSYHREPQYPADVHSVSVRRWERSGMPWKQLRWTSTWEPDPLEPGTDRWKGYDHNDRASAWLLRHDDDQPRPWVVVVHGTEQGRLLVDQRVFRVRHMYEDLGANVIMPLLPLHASRRPRQCATSGFPTLDTLDNIHGLAQSAFDVRCALEWVRSQDPAGISLVGLSLGGGVAALVAGLDEPFDGVLGLVPAVDFPELFHRQTPHEMRSEASFMHLDVSSRRLHSVVSPLSFTPATPPQRLHVLAGLNDRLLDPRTQAGPLIEHWATTNSRWVDQGHVTHMGTGAMVEMIDAALP